jgi:hypothetical protein
VPLKLYNEDNGENVWQNSRPSSTWYCRPIKFDFVKETEALIQLEVAAIKVEISNLNKFECKVADSTVFVRFDMNFTMIDGKVCNAVSENRCEALVKRCYIYTTVTVIAHSFHITPTLSNAFLFLVLIYSILHCLHV